MACKAFDSTGDGSLSTILRCLDWAMSLPDWQRPHIMSNSYGAYNYSQILANSYLPALQSAGVLFVAAAGNEGLNNDNNSTASYPAAYAADIVLSVGASTAFDERAYFSNYGITSVDLAAPGTDINSTAPFDLFLSYTRLESGTSMSTPLVAGAAALLLSAFPSAGALDVKEALMKGANTVPPANSWYLRSVTSGRVNVTRAAMYLANPWPFAPYPIPYEAPALVVPFNGSELSGTAFPMQNSSLLFTWNGITYDNCTLALPIDEQSGDMELPIDTSVDGLPVLLGDDGSQIMFLQRPVQFFGRNYSTLFVGANGFVTFGSSSGAFIPTLENHYSLPRVSGLFVDLTPDPPASRIEFLEVTSDVSPGAGEEETAYPLCLLGSGGVVITYRNLRHYIDGPLPSDPIPRSTFQILISYEGNVMLAWRDIHIATDTVVGLSDGVVMLDGVYSFDAAPECDDSCPRTTYDAPAVVLPPTADDRGEITSPFPLGNSTLLFTWNGAGYDNCTLELPIDEQSDETGLPIDTSEGGEQLFLSDDGSVEKLLDRPVRFFGRDYWSLHVGSNGFVTFGSGSTLFSPTLTNHYSLPRISALLTDLVPDPPNATIEFMQANADVGDVDPSEVPYPYCLLGTGGVVVTYRNVRPYLSPDGPLPTPELVPRSTFQIIISNEGNVMLAWADVYTVSQAVVGLSDGVQMPSDVEYSLEAVPECDGSCPLQRPAYDAPAVLIPSGGDPSFQLEGLALTYTWNGDGYDNCSLALPVDQLTGEAELPINTTEMGQRLWLYNNESEEKVLSRPMVFFGRNYSSLHVGANGYITFGSGSSDYAPTLESHYSLPRVSGLFIDLYPDPPVSSIEFMEVNAEDEFSDESNDGGDASGAVPYPLCLLGTGGVVVTYRDVAFNYTALLQPGSLVSQASRSTFQIIISYEGNVMLAWSKVQPSIEDAVVGLSDGVMMAGSGYSLDAVSECDDTTCPRPPYDAPALLFPAFTSSNSTFPLTATALTYAWNGDGYDNCTTPLSLDAEGEPLLPVDTAIPDATVLQLGDDDAREFILSRPIPYFAMGYESIHIASNGYVGLGSNASIWTGSLDAHYSSPRVSGLLTDLTPDEESSVEVLEVAPGEAHAFTTCPVLGANGGVVITFRNIRHFMFGSQPEEDIPRSTFQIILSFDGTILMAYGTVHLQRDVVLGLSNGFPMPSSYSLASVPVCPDSVCSLARLSCGLWRVRYKLAVGPATLNSPFHADVVVPMVAHRIAEAMDLPLDSPRIELSKEWEREGQKPGCTQRGAIVISQWDMWFDDLQEAKEFWKFVRRYGNVAKRVKGSSHHVCNVSHKPQAPRLRNKVCMESSIFDRSQQP
jgi:hypothetical protein